VLVFRCPNSQKRYLQPPKTMFLIPLLLLVLATFVHVDALNIVIPGGTGKIGQKVASALGSQGHTVQILCRNSFLASAPARVSGDFGWVGKAYLNSNPRVSLRDWDGGDLLDIVGQDWLGWQDDALAGADAVVNLVGGYTEQRVWRANASCVKACASIPRRNRLLSVQWMKI